MSGRADHPEELDDDLQIEDYYVARDRLARSRARLEPLDPVMSALLDAADRFLEERYRDVLH